VAAERGIKVVLSGLGGDELFAGYTTFWKAPLLAKHPAWFRRLARVAPARLLGDSERAKLETVTDQLTLDEAYLLQRSIRWGHSPVRLHARPGNNSYRAISYAEASFYMRNQLLRDSDIFSSANSIELRVPFLDRELLQVAWGLPDRHHRSLLSG